MVCDSKPLKISLCILIFLIGWTAIGCNTQPPGPTLAELVGDLDSLHANIEEGIANNDAMKVHMALHSVSSNLTKLKKIESGKLSDADTTSVQEAAARMQELYDKIDKAIHKEETPDYDSVAEELAAELAKIRSIAQRDKLSQPTKCSG